jgi:hypothetical protein
MSRLPGRKRDGDSTDGATYKARLRQYERRERSLLWIGAGLVGFIALAAGDLGAALLRGDPLFIKGSMVTLVIVGGAAVGASRMDFEWHITDIKRALDDGKAKEDDQLPPNLRKWPRTAETFRDVSLACLALSGLAFVAGSWWT